MKEERREREQHLVIDETLLSSQLTSEPCTVTSSPRLPFCLRDLRSPAFARTLRKMKRAETYLPWFLTSLGWSRRLTGEEPEDERAALSSMLVHSSMISRKAKGK